MKGQVLPVKWDGVVVGSIIEPKVDNFDLYGKWVPSQSIETARFLELLGEGMQLDVQVGNNEPQIKGTIEAVPSIYIEIKMRP